MSRRARSALLAAVVLVLGGPSPATAQVQASACAEVESFSALDFWLGEWEVLVNGSVVGHNTIEPILDGCAIMEHWRGSEGGAGKSLFFHNLASGEWKQIWVTDRATATGGLKEKVLVERPGGGLRFQGTIARPDGSTYLDRTTLTPLPDGTVRQVIEISMDGGDNWRVAWDAVYRRHSPER